MRPNPLGLSLVRLVERRGAELFVEDLDVLDGTPLLDIKPYVEGFDLRLGTRGGWTEKVSQRDVSAPRHAAVGRSIGASAPQAGYIDHEDTVGDLVGRRRRVGVGLHQLEPVGELGGELGAQHLGQARQGLDGDGATIGHRRRHCDGVDAGVGAVVGPGPRSCHC